MPAKRVRDGSGLRFGEGSIRERSESFEARWRELQDDGTYKRRARTFASHDLAEDFLRNIHRARRDGRYIPPSERTVADLIGEWLERGSRSWSTWTAITYRKRAELHITPLLGSIRAESLTSPRVQHWIDRLVRKGLSPATIEAAHQNLSQALNEAVLIGALPVNVARGVRRPAVHAPAIATWSAEDVGAVLSATAAESKWHALYLLAVTSGMRPGELRALRWADLDLEAGFVTVRRTMTRDATGRQVVGSTTKTRTARIVSLAPATIAALSTWRTDQKLEQMRAARWQKTNLVFTRKDGDFLSVTSWQRAHARFCAAANVTKIRLHDLRHTSATLSLHLGESPKIVADRLGHANVATTLGRYSHGSVALQKAATEALEARILGVGRDNIEAKIGET